MKVLFSKLLAELGDQMKAMRTTLTKDIFDTQSLHTLSYFLVLSCVLTFSSR